MPSSCVQALVAGGRRLHVDQRNVRYGAGSAVDRPRPFLAILVLRTWASVRGRAKVSIFRRTIPRETVIQAMVTALLFAGMATVGLTVLLAFEQSRLPHVAGKGLFLDTTFEVFSALGTVGLSTGVTGELTTVGRVIIIALMFMGRLGPITVFTALSRDEQQTPIEFSSEEPLIG